MILIVPNNKRELYGSAVRSYYRLRKAVFCDKLGWEVKPTGDEEFDELDDGPCTYVLNVDEHYNVKAGSRLIPSTQQTFLDTYFPDLVPSELRFRAATIWESSRYCTSDDAGTDRIRSGQKRAAVEHIAGGVQFGVANGITHYIAVVEERLFKLTRNFFPSADILGRKIVNCEPVVCAIWPLDEECVRITQYVASLATVQANAA